MKIVMFRCWYIVISIVVGFVTIANCQKNDPSYENGSTIFETNCSPCHDVHKEIVGPMLASIPKKRPQAWLSSFIKNSQNVIVSGDQYATALFLRYNQQVMPSFQKLNEQDIADILHYIEEESLHPTEPVDEVSEAEHEGPEEVLRGKMIFQNQCQTCHHVLTETDEAPALGSVTKRHSHEWLVSFIHNSQKVIQSGDEYANYLFGSFDKHVMVPMEFLSKQDIDAVLAYIEFTSSSEHYQGGANGRVVRPSDPEGHVHSGYPNVNPWKGDAKIFLIVVSSLAALVHAYLIVRLLRYVNR